jgi:hypothetical protein
MFEASAYSSGMPSGSADKNKGITCPKVFSGQVDAARMGSKKRQMPKMPATGGEGSAMTP